MSDPRDAVFEEIQAEMQRREAKAEIESAWHNGFAKGLDVTSEALAEYKADLTRRIEGLPQMTVHADPFFPETFDYQTVARDAVLAEIAKGEE